MRKLLIDNPAGPDGRFNLGDDIQIIAAERFMPDHDGFIAKDSLPEYQGEPAQVILNGWFMHSANKWPPSEQILPLMVSFHMNPIPSAQMLERGKDFFERHAPVGCRDYKTLELLEAKRIPAYYSGCLTLTLEREKFSADLNAARSGIYAVDILYKMRKEGGVRNILRRLLRGVEDIGAVRSRMEQDILDRLVPSVDREKVDFVKHSRPLRRDEISTRHAAAREVLGLYAGAKLVITSRIHCALPCIAFGTPVIFVDGALGHDSERARLRGIIDLMPVLPVARDGQMDFEALERDLLPESVAKRTAEVQKIRDALKEKCTEFCNGRQIV